MRKTLNQGTSKGGFHYVLVTFLIKICTFKFWPFVLHFTMEFHLMILNLRSPLCVQFMQLYIIVTIWRENVSKWLFTNFNTSLMGCKALRLINGKYLVKCYYFSSYDCIFDIQLCCLSKNGSRVLHQWLICCSLYGHCYIYKPMFD
jgi:hypothetical protein